MPVWQTAYKDRLPDLLLAWFDRSGRILPWRQNKDPYRIWLSEIMLQQTQVQTVIPYYQRFLDRWPTIADLAAADDVQVLKLWEGLGYYSRARHLLQAARLVAREMGGRMPDTEADLLRLPGIGAYTAGAILSIAFGQPVAAVDGNVVRVFARLTAVPWNPADPADRRTVRQWVLAVLPADRPGDFNEALMDLGATVCLPRQPACSDCPLGGICLGLLTGRLAELPRKTAAKAVPQEEKTVLALTGPLGFHVNRRPAGGLLGDLFEFDWLDAAVAAAWLSADQADPAGDPGLAVTRLAGHRHRFTHLVWILTGYHIALPTGERVLSGLPPVDPVIIASLRRMLRRRPLGIRKRSGGPALPGCAGTVPAADPRYGGRPIRPAGGPGGGRVGGRPDLPGGGRVGG